MGKKIRKTVTGTTSKLIKSEIVYDPNKELVKLSFKYLIKDNPAYPFTNQSTTYFCKVFDRLSHVCGMTLGEIQYPSTKALRNHFINWEDTTQREFGLPNEQQLVNRPFQFGISANEHGRVIGFFIGFVFYVVWFDPDHNTYS